MKIHAHATQRQFWRHIRPVWEALPEELRGERITDKSARAFRHLPSTDAVIVGAYGSVELCGKRKVIYVEHGAGQQYKNIRPWLAPHYPGGQHPENVVGYLCPNQIVADAWKRPAVVVGCPALEGISVRGGSAVITFHWDAPRVAPEARSARPHYIRHLHEIVQWIREAELTPIGHRHPRDERAPKIWENLGIEFVDDADEALIRARIVIADNTSFAYEACQLGIPNITLNAPWYRRHIEHGLRFWSHPPGVMVDGPEELVERRLKSYLNDSGVLKQARVAAERAYGVTQGGAKIGAEFIVDLLT